MQECCFWVRCDCPLFLLPKTVNKEGGILCCGLHVYVTLRKQLLDGGKSVSLWTVHQSWAGTLTGDAGLSVLPTPKKNESHYALSSSDKYNLTVPRVRTEMEKRAFSCATLSSWNNLQTHLKTSEFVSIETICSIPNNVHLSAHVFFYLVLYFKDVLQTSQVIHENDISIWMGLYVVK